MYVAGDDSARPLDGSASSGGTSASLTYEPFFGLREKPFSLSADPRFLFTGIYLVNSEFIARIPAATKLSVVPIFCEMIRAGAKLGGVVIDEGHWWDLGNREHYLAVHGALAAQEVAPWIHPTAQIAPTATISGATAIGAGVRIGEHASVNDSLLWEGAEIASGTLLNHCIVTDSQRVEGIHSHADF